MDLVMALREASDFYAKERPRATVCELQTEIGQSECEGIARRLDDAANEIERLAEIIRINHDGYRRTIVASVDGV